jgi:hypothetical protein
LPTFAGKKTKLCAGEKRREMRPQSKGMRSDHLKNREARCLLLHGAAPDRITRTNSLPIHLQSLPREKNNEADTSTSMQRLPVCLSTQAGKIELMLNPMIMLGDEDHTQTLVPEWIGFSCISKKHM